jgi:hypothetical protein
MRRPAFASAFVTSAVRKTIGVLWNSGSASICAAISPPFSLWHHYVEQDQIRPEIPGTLMSLGSVVFFEQDFDHMGAVAVVINNQDASLFLHRRVLQY